MVLVWLLVLLWLLQVVVLDVKAVVLQVRNGLIVGKMLVVVQVMLMEVLLLLV